jgi:hypothetical protein
LATPSAWQRALRGKGSDSGSLTRLGAAGTAASGQRVFGRRQLVTRETFDQLDHFEPLPRREFDESPQQPQAFDSFTRWISDFLVQL